MRFVPLGWQAAPGLTRVQVASYPESVWYFAADGPSIGPKGVSDAFVEEGTGGDMLTDGADGVRLYSWFTQEAASILRAWGGPASRGAPVGLLLGSELVGVCGLLEGSRYSFMDTLNETEACAVVQSLRDRP